MVLEVCWDLAVLQDLLECQASPEWTDLQVPKETWDHKGNRAHQVSREFLEPRVSLVPKVRSDHLDKKDLRAGRGFLDYLELMGLLVILVRRVHLERKVPRVHWVLKVLLVILALGV